MINKNTIPKVAYEIMNEVHYEEVGLLNELESLLNETTLNTQAVDATLQTLLAHTHEHFSNKERLMQEVSFPAFMLHQGEHLRVLDEMKRAINQYQTQQVPDILRKYFLGSLQEWLMIHISTHKGCA